MSVSAVVMAIKLGMENGQRVRLLKNSLQDVSQSDKYDWVLGRRCSRSKLRNKSESYSIKKIIYD